MWVKKMEWQMQPVAGIMEQHLQKKKKEAALLMCFEPICVEEK